MRFTSYASGLATAALLAHPCWFTPPTRLPLLLLPLRLRLLTRKNRLTRLLSSRP